MKNCIYRFINNSDEIIYIGKAIDLNQRLNNHNHLPKECYEERVKIEYFSLATEDEIDLAERYLIAKIKPKYNVIFKNKDISFNLEEFDKQEWIEYNKKYSKDHKVISFKNNIDKINNEKEKIYNDKINSKIICISTGEIFENMNNIVDIYNITIQELIKHCDDNIILGLIHPIYKCSVMFMYYEEYKNKYRENKQNFDYIIKKNTRKVICITTKKCYNNIFIAEEECNIKNITRCCDNLSNYVGIIDNKPMVWKWYDEYKNMTEREIENYINKAMNIARRRKAIM